jgi:LmbE family N-acetylglucosaminyl deacetylase
MDTIIYLSPHLDDAVLSCGAFIWEQVHSEKKTVEIWTVFAADPSQVELSAFASELHMRWQTGREGPALRRSEDEKACARLGSKAIHLPFPDCIYRSLPDGSGPRISTNGDLFSFDLQKDLPLVREVTHYLAGNLPMDCDLIVPLGVGSHIDHQIVRMAAEALNRRLLYHADFPYAGDHPDQVKEKTIESMEPIRYPTGQIGLNAWQEAVAAYVSQISTFWPSVEEMKTALEEYSKSAQGSILWKKKLDVLPGD